MFNHWKFENREILKKKNSPQISQLFFDGLFGEEFYV